MLKLKCKEKEKKIMANKITNKEMYERVINELTSADLKDFIRGRIELIDKKAERAKNATRKPTANQLANEEIKSNIMDYLNTVASATIADIKTRFDLSSQKVTPLVNSLVESGKATKTVEKRVAHYSKA